MWWQSVPSLLRCLWKQWSGKLYLCLQYIYFAFSVLLLQCYSMNWALNNLTSHVVPFRHRTVLNNKYSLKLYIFMNWSNNAKYILVHSGMGLTILYNTVLHCTVLLCTKLYCTVLYRTVPYCTILYILTYLLSTPEWIHSDQEWIHSNMVWIHSKSMHVFH